MRRPTETRLRSAPPPPAGRTGREARWASPAGSTRRRARSTARRNATVRSRRTRGRVRRCASAPTHPHPSQSWSLPLIDSRRRCLPIPRSASCLAPPASPLCCPAFSCSVAYRSLWLAPRFQGLEPAAKAQRIEGDAQTKLEEVEADPQQVRPHGKAGALVLKAVPFFL